MKRSARGSFTGLLTCLLVLLFSGPAFSAGTIAGSLDLHFDSAPVLQWVRYNPYVSGQAQFGAISEFTNPVTTELATGVFNSGGMYKIPATVGTPWIDSASSGENYINASYDAYNVSFSMHTANTSSADFTNTYFSINPTLFFTPGASFAPFFYDYSFLGSMGVPGSLNAAIQLTVGYSDSPYGFYGDVLYTNYLNPASQYPNAYNDPDYYHSGIVNSIDTGDMTKWVFANANGDGFATPDGSEKYWYVTISMGSNAYDYSSPVPVPAAIWFLGSGLAALLGIKRKMRL